MKISVVKGDGSTKIPQKMMTGIHPEIFSVVFLVSGLLLFPVL